MIPLSKHLREYLETVKGDIIIDLDSNHMNATGFLRSSLRVVENQYLDAQLRGANYLPFVQTQPRTRKPNSPRFWYQIFLWMQAKGIAPERDGKVLPATTTNLRRSAYAIAKGITERGTKYQRGARGVDLREHMKANLPKALEGISGEFLTQFRDKAK